MTRTSLVPAFQKTWNVKKVDVNASLLVDLEERARLHMRKRAEYALETAVHAFYIAKGNYVDRNAGSAIGITGARYQNETGTHVAHAAHVLPGQITLGNLPLSDRVLAHANADTTGDFLLGAVRLNFMSSATHILPTNFNKVDSRFERVGGKRAFEALVQTTWHAGRQAASHDPAPLPMFERAYAQFVLSGRAAFEAAIQRLEEKLRDAPNDVNLQTQLRIARVEAAAAETYRPEILHAKRLDMVANMYTGA